MKKSYPRTSVSKKPHGGSKPKMGSPKAMMVKPGEKLPPHHCKEMKAR